MLQLQYKIITLCTVLLLSVISCKKSEDTKYFGNQNTISISGIVSDQINGVLSGVEVKVNDKITITDAEGRYRINEIVQSGSNLIINYKKDGYIALTRNESASQSKIINVSLTSLSSDMVMQSAFSANQGTLITTKDGSFVSLPGGNNYKDTDGNLYNGQVVVKIVYINPDMSNFYHLIDGSSYMVDEFGQFLESFGVLRVELTDSYGNEIFYQNDSLFKSMEATIGITIPQSKVNTSPQYISLYSYDNTKSAYVASGSASKGSSGQYIGSVQHFSSWTCAIPGSVTSQGSAQYTINGGIYSNQLFSLFNSFLAFYHIDTTGTGTNYTYIDCSGSDGYFFMSLDNVQSVGSYTIGSGIGAHFAPPGSSQITMQSGTINITSYDSVGGLIEGTFSGICSDGTYTYNVNNGSFSMIRSPNQ